MGVLITYRAHHTHADKLIIQVLNCVRGRGVLGVELLNLGHRVLNPDDEGGQGLVLLLPNQKEVVPGIEVSSWALLDVDRLQGGPDLCRIILHSIYMGSLFSRKGNIQLTCSLVHSNILFDLKISLGVIRALLSIADYSPEAFGVQESLHFTLPSGVVGGAEFGEGRG